MYKYITYLKLSQLRSLESSHFKLLFYITAFVLFYITACIELARNVTKSFKLTLFRLCDLKWLVLISHSTIMRSEMG